MGVSGLWELLAPTGHYVPIEHLTGRRVAVDVSVWLTQFIKAMRDANGMMFRNAHLLGFFRRCLRLLFHGIRPVFVFDGATPYLKRKTILARAANKDRQALKLRQLAEKLLHNRLKSAVLDSVSAAAVTVAAAPSASGAPTVAPSTEVAPRESAGSSEDSSEQVPPDQNGESPGEPSASDKDDKQTQKETITFD